MTLSLGVVMDPIGSISVKKDSTYAMLLEAQARNWDIRYMEQNDLSMRDGKPLGHTQRLELSHDPDRWFELNDPKTIELADLDVILMRKDPPFNMDYVYTTYLLEQAETRGVLVVNRPASLRDANEKLFTAWVPECTPPTLVASKYSDLRGFLTQQKDIILKPLDGMGGASIFRLTLKDPNISVVMETLTRYETRFIMAQRYIPEVVHGDKRVLMVNGEPVDFALARIPPPGETRGNLAVGATGEGVPLSERDRWICSRLTDVLLERGIMFAGLDIIGDYLTEINVTSPTCIRELDAIYNLNISGMLLDAIESKLSSGS
ncbi:MAG: glutathione synthase [Gammaproteobacteria bacterium]|nr:glutathione synthase [Gammaproteobacteria bacterium]